jgi:hypothetical protein
VYGGATEFAFYMIPRDDADGSPLRRNTAVPDQPPQHITLRYPYVRLGPLRSHVFPHFAVVNAALKLEEHHDAFLENTLRILKGHFDPVVQNLDDASALFAKISQLHDIWMAGLHKHLPTHRITHAALAGGSDSESAMWSAQEKALKDPDVLHWVADLNQGLHESKGRQKVSLAPPTASYTGSTNVCTSAYTRRRGSCDCASAVRPREDADVAEARELARSLPAMGIRPTPDLVRPSNKRFLEQRLEPMEGRHDPLADPSGMMFSFRP